MANPKNNLTIMGTVKKTFPLKQKNGVVFGQYFEVSVSRDYRNQKGDYESDVIPIKFTFSSESIKQFAGDIRPGDEIIVLGTLRVEQVASGQKLCVYAYSISSDSIRDRKMNPAQAQKVVQLPLPIS